MRLHAGVAAGARTLPCRALVAGYGTPGCRDLDFGEQFVQLAEGLDWPDGVVVEGLSYSAHLVLHRLQELRPAKLILVGAVSRGLDPPGTVRRYQVDLPPPSPADVHADLAEAIGGRVGLDNMLSVVRHFGGLPADTTVVEVEAADSSFGLGFSEELAAAIDPLLALVREELGDLSGSHMETALPAALGRAPADPTSSSPGRAPGGVAADATPPGITQLLDYAEAHAQMRALEALSARLPALPGVALAARFLPAAGRLGMSGAWHDVLPLAGGALGVVVGDIACAPRVRGANVVAQLKMAVHALALVEGDRPASLVGHLDEVVRATGIGRASTLVYLTVEPGTGKVRVANAGHCLPVVVRPDGAATFPRADRWPALGAGRAGLAPTVVRIEPGSTLLLFSDSLVQAPERSPAEGLERVRRAAEHGPRPLDALCDHVLASCRQAGEAPADHDVSLLAVRLLA